MPSVAILKFHDLFHVMYKVVFSMYKYMFNLAIGTSK